MTNIASTLQKLIEVSRISCENWLKNDLNGGLRLFDPVDKTPIIAHYGDSHLACALILLGKTRKDNDMTQRGINLIQTVLRDWKAASSSADFHHDFNSFALCLAAEWLGSENQQLVHEIQAVVLSTQDSSHDTVNWLPMRAYVNFCRSEWTNDKNYEHLGQEALRKVSRATNSDGGIEDRLPFGVSYNLQYNISSIAILIIIADRWPSRMHIPEGGLQFLISKTLPDGDINYMGRGANQIFAWGPWIYALSACGNESALSSALLYLINRYQVSAVNKNILLNEFDGLDKSFWWDYHYCSVYHAHFLFWAVLAFIQLDRERVLNVCGQGMAINNPNSSAAATGLTVTSNSSGGSAIFNGRSAYLAEAGPSICALWLDDTFLFKGGLGPWKGQFGNKYSFADSIFQNHFGLVAQQRSSITLFSRVLSHLSSKRIACRNAYLFPIMNNIAVKHEKDAIYITFEANNCESYCNIPIFDTASEKFDVQMSIDGRPLSSQIVGRSRNQYGWIQIIRSQRAKGRCWNVLISKRKREN